MSWRQAIKIAEYTFYGVLHIDQRRQIKLERYRKSLI